MHVVKRMSLAVRDKLSDEGARDLEDWVEGRGNEWRDKVTQSVAERFDARLATTAAEIRVDMEKMRSELRQEIANMGAQLRQEMHQGFGQICQAMASVQASLRKEIADLQVNLRTELADNRVELIRWSFVFWMGQVAVMIGVLAYMLRGVTTR